MKLRNFISELKKYLLRGFVILVPAIFTVLLLSFAFGFVSSTVEPLTNGLKSVLDIENIPSIAVDGIALGVLVLIILIVGVISELIPVAKEVTDVFHAVMESIPGIGGVYSSFRKMSVTMIQGENSFRDVKLAEYPSEGCYQICFVTAKNNERISESVGKETITLFVPMAPNPFMGGFVVNLPEERVHDVDMTVRQGIKSVLTSGVTLSEGEEREKIELEDELNELENAIK
jgi:uncharacterized membrane protein